MWLKFKYKQLLIIKHALQYYIKREGASHNDLQAEQSLLEKVEGKVKEFKENYITK